MKNAGVDTVEKVTETLYQAITNVSGYTVTGENTVVLEVELLVSTDGGETWAPATKDNFPAEGFDVVLPYPEGTNAEDYDFTVAHMFGADMNGNKAGDVEILDVEETEDGLKVHVDSLSPFAISWIETAGDEPVVPEDPSEPDTPVTPDEPSVPEEDPTTPEEPSDDTDEPATEDDSDKEDKEESTQTGDDTNMALYFGMMILALAVAGAAVFRRREN
jgi:LPXTG-motif cell wall-anchored protein